MDVWEILTLNIIPGKISPGGNAMFVLPVSQYKIYWSLRHSCISRRHAKHMLNICTRSTFPHEEGLFLRLLGCGKICGVLCFLPLTNWAHITTVVLCHTNYIKLFKYWNAFLVFFYNILVTIILWALSNFYYAHVQKLVGGDRNLHELLF